MNQVSAWSWSRFALYEQCPLAFKLKNIDKIEEPPSAAMQRGRDVHKALERYIIGEADLPPEVKHPFHVKLYAEMRAVPAEDKVVEQQWGFQRSWKPTTGRGWFGKAVWLRASLDLGIMYEDATFEAVDHKTGKKYGHNDDQMELFALSVMCKYTPVTHVTTRLVYLDSGEQEFGEFPASDREALKAKWEGKVAPMFADTTFAPRPNDKCRFCAYAKGKGGQCKFG